MKNRKILIDTSIWIEYFKNNENISSIVDNKLDNDSACIAGPVISELLQGVKSQKELDILVKHIDAIPCFHIGTKDWIDAGILSYSLRKKGITLPLTDVVLAVTAKNNHAAIFTLDKHFKFIPDVTLFDS